MQAYRQSDRRTDRATDWCYTYISACLGHTYTYKYETNIHTLAKTYRQMCKQVYELYVCGLFICIVYDASIDISQVCFCFHFLFTISWSQVSTVCNEVNYILDESIFVVSHTDDNEEIPTHLKNHKTYKKDGGTNQTTRNRLPNPVMEWLTNPGQS